MYSPQHYSSKSNLKLKKIVTDQALYDSLSDMSYLNKLRNNLDFGYKKSSVYNKSSYEQVYKSPQGAIKTKTGKPEDHKLFSNYPRHVYTQNQSPEKLYSSSVHMPLCKPLTNPNQVAGMSFRGKSIYKMNFNELSPGVPIQKQSPKDHLKGKNDKLGNYVFESVYKKGYQDIQREIVRPSLKPKDNDHFFNDIKNLKESIFSSKYKK